MVGNYVQLRRARVRHERDACNGIALHRRHLPFGGTFLTFSDYCAQRAAHGRVDEDALASSSSRTTRSDLARTARRISPIEHAASLRLIPGLDGLASVRYRRDRAGLGVRGGARPSVVPAAEPPEPALRFPRRGARSTRIERGGYVLRDWPGSMEPADTRIVLIA